MLSLLLAFTVASSAPAPSSSTSPGMNGAARNVRPRVLVLDVELAAADKDEGALVGRQIVQALAPHARDAFDVITADDLRSVLNVEAERQLLGCAKDAQSTSCMTELADAMDAEFVLHSKLSRVGDGGRLLALDLLRVSEAAAVARETLSVERARELRELGPKLDVVLASFAREIAPDRAVSAGAGPSVTTLIAGGTALAAGVTSAALFAWVGAMELTLGNATAAPSDKSFAVRQGPYILAGAGVAAAVATGGTIFAVVAE